MPQGIGPNTLLCERCGYPIDGLPAASNCPECGTPTAASMPEARTGSPWQQRAGLRTFLSTNWLVLHRPHELFSSLRLEWRSASALLAVNLLIAAVTVLAPWSGVLLDDPVRAISRGQTLRFLRIALLIIPLQVLAIAAVLLLLTLIEWAGIQFYARRRGARLGPAAAWQVVTHASIGWVIAAGFMFVTLVLWLNVSFFQVLPSVRSNVGASDWAAAAIPGIGALAGLLVFETLVSIGVRRCRFANRPRPAAPA